MTGQAGTEIQVRIHERQEHWAQRTGLSVPVLYSEDSIMYRLEATAWDFGSRRSMT